MIRKIIKVQPLFYFHCYLLQSSSKDEEIREELASLMNACNRGPQPLAHFTDMRELTDMDGFVSRSSSKRASPRTPPNLASLITRL